MSLRVKMCGFTSTRDVMEAAFAGVHYCGFVFAPKSRRNLPPTEKTRQWLQELSAHKPESCRFVAVTTSTDPKFWQQLAQWQVFSAIQLSLPISELALLQESDLSALYDQGMVVWLALNLAFLVQGVNWPWLWDWQERHADQALGLVVDSIDAAGYGGSGQRISPDVSLVQQIRQLKQALPFLQPWFLAGGLANDNIRQTYQQWCQSYQAAAGREVFPFAGVDLSGGVEDKNSAPAKSPDKIQQFMTNVAQLGKPSY